MNAHRSEQRVVRWITQDSEMALAGKCGCIEVDTVSDGDGTHDYKDKYPKTLTGEAETDSDSDAFPDRIDDCPTSLQSFKAKRVLVRTV
jgi:hypothetical protein